MKGVKSKGIEERQMIKDIKNVEEEVWILKISKYFHLIDIRDTGSNCNTYLRQAKAEMMVAYAASNTRQTAFVNQSITESISHSDK